MYAFRQAAVLLATDCKEAAARLHEWAFAHTLRSVKLMQTARFARLGVKYQTPAQSTGFPSRFRLVERHRETGEAVELKIPELVYIRFDQHVMIYLPILRGDLRSSALFAGIDGKPVQPDLLSSRLAEDLPTRLAMECPRSNGKQRS
jgi:hypothetical protein